MSVRLGLGVSRGTPLIAGTTLVIVGVAAWWAGFSVVGALLLAVGLVVVLERRRRPTSSVSEEA